MTGLSIKSCLPEGSLSMEECMDLRAHMPVVSPRTAIRSPRMGSATFFLSKIYSSLSFIFILLFILFSPCFLFY